MALTLNKYYMEEKMKRPLKETQSTDEYSPSDFFIMNPYSSRLPYFAFGSYLKFIKSQESDKVDDQILTPDARSKVKSEASDKE